MRCVVMTSSPAHLTHPSHPILSYPLTLIMFRHFLSFLSLLQHYTTATAIIAVDQWLGQRVAMKGEI